MHYLEPRPGSVITWLHRFTPYGKVYQYVAVSIPGRGWYLSDRTHKPYPWEELVKIIGDAPAFVATSWAPLIRGADRAGTDDASGPAALAMVALGDAYEATDLAWGRRGR